MNGWSQTLSVILALVTTAVGGTLWFQSKHTSMVMAISSLRHEQSIMNYRLFAGGWSRWQQQAWVDELREVADHPLPTLKKIPPEAPPAPR